MSSDRRPSMLSDETNMLSNENGDRIVPSVVVFGQIGRDLILKVEEIPEAGAASAVQRRIEVVGGKGANQAIGLVQLGIPARLVAVSGVDAAGGEILQEIAGDGVDTAFVTRRGETALLVDVVDQHGRRRLLEHVPEQGLLTPADVQSAITAGVLDDADTVCLQLQQPLDALLTAAEAAHRRAIRVVLDGAASGPMARRLLELADVVRADPEEAELLAGRPLRSPDEVYRAAEQICGAGPRLVIMTVANRGEAVTWREGRAFIPFRDTPILDPTGGGDAFIAGLVAAIRRNLGPEEAARVGSRAAASTIARLGGRPDLSELCADTSR